VLELKYEVSRRRLAAGAASIGQVHAALLHDGRQVAMKIQYPAGGDLSVVFPMPHGGCMVAANFWLGAHVCLAAVQDVSYSVQLLDKLVCLQCAVAQVLATVTWLLRVSWLKVARTRG
jgi:hypothetical protein